MAGKKDIVEQALKLVMGEGDEGVARIKLRGHDSRPDWDAVMEDIEAGTSPHPFSGRERIYNDRSTFEISPFGEELHLGDIRALQPNQGAGTELLDFLKGIADKHQVPITGTAKVYHSSPGYISETEKLADWYRKRGFEVGEGYPEDGYEIRYNPRVAKGGGGFLDDVVKLAGKVISGEGDDAAQAGIRAYHGSPHDFDKFDMSKIGTGEGAQAYGHGLYFAENEGVARGYRDALQFGPVPAKITYTPDERARGVLTITGGDIPLAISHLEYGLSEAKTEDKIKSIAETIRILKEAPPQPSGKMYEVNIAADPNTFLDWDKPLSEQPDIYEKLKSSGKLNVNEAVVAGTEKRLISLAGQLGINDLVPIRVQSGLRRGLSLSDALTEAKGATQNPEWSAQVDKLAEAILPTGVEMKGNLPQNWTGQSLVDSKVNGLTKRQVSEILSKEGIPGIKYLDAGSRGAGDGTRNYVVFDDKLISIIRKYGIAGASAMLGYNLMDGLDSKQALAATMADQDYQNASGQGEPRVAKGGGGAALEKALEKALLVAREGIEGLAKSKGKTPQELLGGFANQKPRVPFEEWRYEFEPTADLLQSKEFSPESLKPGDVIIPLIGDRTSTGRKITSIAGQPLETPAITEGGPDYMRGPSQQADKSVWASGKGVISQLEGRIQNALRASEAKGYKDPSVYGSYVAMGPQSGDFSTHTAEAVMGMLPGSKIKRADVKEFDAKMRERFADWPGIKSPKAADYVINANAGEHRKAFLDVMDSAYWRDKGFPDVSLARYATTTPELVSAPTEAAGYNIARITPSQKPELITQIHRSYPSTMHGEYVGGLPAGMTRDELFTQFSRGFDADPPARNYVMAKRRSFGMDPNAFQVMDEPEIQALIDKVERIKQGYEQGGEVYEDDDINDALRIAKDNGGSTGSVFMTDAKGINYDINGNIIPPEVTGPNPARSEATPEQVGQRAAQDPATFDALMQRYAVPDQDIARYEATKAAVAKQPYETQQMTHVGAPPMRDVKVDMPLLGGEKKITQAPYNVAGPMSMAAQTAYDLKTVPLYFTPFTAPIGAGLDIGEGVATGDPLQASLAALGAPGKYAKAAIIGGSNYLMSPAEAQAGPARWFSKAMEVANAIPMNKMTGEQALAMLRKGTSPEELKWTGTDVFLQGKPQVTKQELVDYLNKNRVQTKEIVLGGTNKPTRLENIDIIDIPAEIRDRHPEVYRLSNRVEELRDELNKLRSMPDQSGLDYYDNFRAVSQEFSNSQAKLMQAKEALRKEYAESIGGLGVSTKYGPDSVHGETLTTPGGKNYSENLYALPQKDIYTPFVEQMRKDVWEMNFTEAMKEGFGEERAKNFADKFNALPAWTLAKFLGKEEELKSVFEAQKSFGPQYTGGHWGDISPDVLFHTRTSELIYEPPGANRPYRVHSVEEAQSDPGQAGRKRGFKDQKAMAEVARLTQQTQDLRSKLKSEQARLYAEHQKRIAPYVEERVRYERDLLEKYKKGEISLGDMNRLAESYGSPEPEITGQYRAATYQVLNPIMDKIAANEAEINRIGSKIGEIPMMPFISSTEAWTDRAIKHELDKAFDNGSDYFSWTPGEAQAERYDLSRHIGKIDYNPDDGSLIAYNPEGKMVINTSVNDPSELDEYVGEELAKKLRAEEESRRSSINEYDVEKDEETGEWSVSLYGEPSYDYNGEPLLFRSKGEAKDYLNELMANEFANQPVTLSGLDIKTGGEGMVGYYDKIFLKRVQDVIKKATGIKPNIEVIEVQTANGPRKQLGIRLTDEMREKARFSDFNKGGRVTGGNTYDNDSSVAHALALTSEY